MQIVDSFTVLPPCRTIILAMPKSPWTRATSEFLLFTRRARQTQDNATEPSSASASELAAWV